MRSTKVANVWKCSKRTLDLIIFSVDPLIENDMHAYKSISDFFRSSVYYLSLGFSMWVKMYASRRQHENKCWSCRLVWVKMVQRIIQDQALSRQDMRECLSWYLDRNFLILTWATFLELTYICYWRFEDKLDWSLQRSKEQLWIFLAAKPYWGRYPNNSNRIQPDFRMLY